MFMANPLPFRCGQVDALPLPYCITSVHGVLPTATTSHRTPLSMYSCDVDQAGFWGPKPSLGAHSSAVSQRGALGLLLARRGDSSVYSCKIG